MDFAFCMVLPLSFSFYSRPLLGRWKVKWRKYLSKVCTLINCPLTLSGTEQYGSAWKIISTSVWKIIQRRVVSKFWFSEIAPIERGVVNWLTFLVWHWFVDKKVLKINELAVAGPFVVVKRDSSQSWRKISAGCQVSNQIIVKLQPVKVGQMSEGAGVDCLYLAMGEVQSLQVL